MWKDKLSTSQGYDIHKEGKNKQTKQMKRCSGQSTVDPETVVVEKFCYVRIKSQVRQ